MILSSFRGSLERRVIRSKRGTEKSVDTFSANNEGDTWTRGHAQKIHTGMDPIFFLPNVKKIYRPKCVRCALFNRYVK